MKIKIKNIPTEQRETLCSKQRRCRTCPLSTEAGYCMSIHSKFDDNIVDVPEEYFPTNRDLFNSLSDDKLAILLVMLPVFDENSATIQKWLDSPCKYMEETE